MITIGVYEKKANQTRTKLIDVTLKLLTKRPLNRISVNDIVEQADVNRSTFYRYFVDKEALIESYEDQMIEKLEQQRYRIIDHFQATHSLFDEDNIRGIFDIFANDQHNLSILISPRSQSGFHDRLENKLFDMVKNSIREINPNRSDSEIDLICSYHATGLVGIIKLWLSKPQYSEEQILSFINIVTNKGVFNLFLK